MYLRLMILAAAMLFVGVWVEAGIGVALWVSGLSVLFIAAIAYSVEIRQESLDEFFSKRK